MEHNGRSSSLQQNLGLTSLAHDTPARKSGIRAWLSRPSTKNGILALFLILYALLFVVMTHVTTQAMASISAIVLVIAAGWRFGCLAGIAAGLLSMPCNIILYRLLGIDWEHKLFTLGEGVAVAVAFMVIGGIIGHLHSLRTRLLRELAVRERAEHELALHLARLDELVRQRTGELEQANKQLLEDAEERKDALYELNSTKEYLENVIETSLDSIVIIDPGGVIVRVNRALLDLTGCTKGELIGKNVNCLFAFDQCEYATTAGETIEAGPAFFTDAKTMNARLYTEGKISNWEYYLVGKNKTLIPVEENIILLTDAQGRSIGAVGILRDITRRRQTENELKRHRDHLNDLVQEKTGELYAVNEKLEASNRLLRESEQVLKEAQQLAHVGNWERDLFANTNYWSDEMYRILGYEPGEIEPTFENFFKHIHPDDQEKFFSYHNTADVVSLDFRIGQKSGAERFVMALAKIDLNPSGEPERVHGVLSDITERKIAENELLRYQNELEDLVRERTAELEAAQRELVTKEKLSVLGRLTATVSHELRNPLGVIRSSIFYLQKKIQNPDEKTGKHLNRIEEQIVVCDGIVDELLEYTRGRQSEMAAGDISSLLQEIRPLITVPDGVSLDWHASGGIPRIGFDCEKMKRVFINLVQNAIQAVTARQEKNPAFEPRITVEARPDSGGVCIRIQDNGIGMNEETVSRAFEPLFTTRARGTGLGLSIVRKIVYEHRGTVELESRPERGTTVSVWLPTHNP